MMNTLNNVDDNVIILGELITEIKLPNVISEIVLSYLTPSYKYKIILDELFDFVNVLLLVDNIDPSSIDIIKFINLINPKQSNSQLAKIEYKYNIVL
jgi:hypothetical protein